MAEEIGAKARPISLTKIFSGSEPDIDTLRAIRRGLEQSRDGVINMRLSIGWITKLIRALTAVGLFKAKDIITSDERKQVLEMLGFRVRGGATVANKDLVANLLGQLTQVMQERGFVSAEFDDTDEPGYDAQSLIDAIDNVIEEADRTALMDAVMQGGAAVLAFLERFGARRVERSEIGALFGGKKVPDDIRNTTELIDRLTLNVTPTIASTRLATMKRAFDKLADKGHFIDLDESRWLFDLAVAVFHQGEQYPSVSKSEQVAVLTKLGLWDTKTKDLVPRAKAAPLYKEIRDIVAAKLAQQSRRVGTEIDAEYDEEEEELVGVRIVNKNQIYGMLYTVRRDVLEDMVDGLSSGLEPIIINATAEAGWVNELARWEWTKANRGEQAPEVMPQKRRDEVMRTLGLPYKKLGRREKPGPYDENRRIVLKVVREILAKITPPTAAQIETCVKCHCKAKYRCAVCREPYCSTVCQKAAWDGGHAQVCAEIALRVPSFGKKLQDEHGLWTDDGVRAMIARIPARALRKITELFEAVAEAVQSPRVRFDYGEFESGKWVLDFYPRERDEGINERGELIWSFWDTKFAQLGFDTTDMRRPRDINVVSVKHQPKGSKQAIMRLLRLLKEK